MLHHLMFAFASLLAQDGAPPAAPPPVAPTTPARVTPAVKPAVGTSKSATASPGVKKDAKSLVIPTPKPKEPEFPSYRVSVRMPGDRRFTGVVTRDKLFNDLVTLGAHNTREVYRRTESFTLRYVDGVDGDVTLRWNQVVKVDVREILDAAGLKTIEEEYHRLMIVKKEQQDVEQAKQDAEDAKARALRNLAKPGDGDKKDKEKGKEEELPPLLAEFRPDDGWTPKRKEQIEWRRTVVGTGPDKTEQRFLDVYPQWLEAYTAWQATHVPAPADPPKGEPAKDDAKKGDPAKDDAKKDDVKKDETRKDGAPKDPTPAPDPKPDPVNGGGGGAG